MATDPETQASGQEAQDDPVPPALRRRLQQCFDQGSKLAAQEKCNYDYANALFIQCVVNDPGNLTYVQAFLDNLQRKYGNNKRGARLKGFGGRGNLKKAVAKQQWREVLRLGPELLQSNPWDVPTLRAMAQACEAMAYYDVELRYLKNALDANPKDVEVNRHCAESLARMGQFDQAIACWHRIEEVNPNDQEAPKMISMLSTEKARRQAGLGPPASTPARSGGAQARRTEKAEEAGAAADQQQQAKRQIPLTPRQKLERAIADNPSDLPSYIELAQLLREEDRFAEAEQVLAKALNVSGGELRVREALEDTQLEHARQQLAIAEKQAKTKGTDEAKSLAEQMKREVIQREIEVLSGRVDRYPDDRQLKYDLALRLKKVGNYDEAIRYLKEARSDKKLKATATLQLGECLQRQKHFGSALQCYLRAAEVAGEDGQDVECQKAALYRAGVLATAAKELDKARSCLEQLVQIDPQYRDAQARLDKIGSISDKQ